MYSAEIACKAISYVIIYIITIESMQNGNYLVDCPEYNCDNKVS